jgi:lipoate-protein ligase A
VPNVGYLKFNLNINEGKIKHAHIYGDFLGSQGTKMLETKLENIPFTVDAVTQALTRTDLKAIFGPELKQQQILDLLFA